MIKVIGICLGAWALSFAHISKNNDKISIDKLDKIIHNGNPQKHLKEYLTNNKTYLTDNNVKFIATGRKFRKNFNSTNISEAEATELALSFLISKYNYPKLDAVASIGAETFLVYDLDQEQHIKKVNAKNKCASGTGEFFLQQLKRMNISIEEAMKIDDNSTPYKVSGRCSVFCKSDCTHALNVGVEKSRVISGLASMIADKIIELLPHNNTSNPNNSPKSNNILIVGGVSKNKLVINFIKKHYPNCIVPEEADYFEAIGAGIYGTNNFSNIKELSNEQLFNKPDSSFAFHQPIKQSTNKVIFKTHSERNIIPDEECILGIDVGSTTTKAVLLATSDDAILATNYIYTNGDPIKATKECYTTLLDYKLKIIGLGTTGSGRQIVGLHSNSQCVINEITAHSNSAVFYDKSVDTIFEIGGQDAKYTYIVNKVPADYAMNEACSAGTGSFIEEAALESLGVPLLDIEKFALKGNNPPNFSDQCAAFIGSDIKIAQQEGIFKENIIAGLVYSVCYNYLNRVVGNRRIGNKVFMQGGVCYNKSIPIAMANIANKNIIVPPNPGLMGALGVALEVKKRINTGTIIPKKNYNLKKIIELNINKFSPFICNGGTEKCDMKCSINLLSINGKKIAFGGMCDKYNNYNDLQHKNKATNYVQIRNNLIFKDITL